MPGIVVGLGCIVTHGTPAIHIAVVIGSTVPETPLVGMTVMTEVVTVVIETYLEVETAVTTNVTVVVRGDVVIEVGTIGIDAIDAETPRVIQQVERTIEIIASKETTILTGAKDIIHVLVAEVEQVVVIVDSIVEAIHYVVDDFVDVVQEVEVDLIDIVVLTVGKTKFVTHAVRKEAGFTTNFVHIEHSVALQGDGCQHHH